MQNVIIMGRADYVALCSAINDADVNTRNLDDSYTKSEILRKLNQAKIYLQMED